MSETPETPPETFGYHELTRCALGFVLEDETWPVFLAWAAEQATSDAAKRWLAAGPDLATERNAYLRHSPDPYWRALAGQ